MDRNMSKGMIALGLLGATVGVYAATNMSPRERKRMMKRQREREKNWMKNLEQFLGNQALILR